MFHILNGDALLERFLETNLAGEIVVTRECLIEGDLSGDTSIAFWQNRARYLAGAYGEKEEYYFKEVASEFKKLLSAPDTSEFNLWFGYDLFCQANMWFIISLLHSLPIKNDVFVVYPSFLAPTDIWKDFGAATVEDLKLAFQKRVSFSDADLELGKELWSAYKSSDLIKLAALSTIKSSCFPYLEEVCQAHIDRFPRNGLKGRPERIIEEILTDNATDFSSVFMDFTKRAGVYGFGDLQIKKIYDKILHDYGKG